MVARNENISKLKSSYLFPEINQRRKQFQEKNPEAKIISLGVGNTTEPLPSYIANGLEEGARRLGTYEGYTGYGPEQGILELRQKIAKRYYGDKITGDDVFISDGSIGGIGYNKTCIVWLFNFHRLSITELSGQYFLLYFFRFIF